MSIGEQKLAGQREKWKNSGVTKRGTRQHRHPSERKKREREGFFFCLKYVPRGKEFNESVLSSNARLEVVLVQGGNGCVSNSQDEDKSEEGVHRLIGVTSHLRKKISVWVSNTSRLKQGPMC